MARKQAADYEKKSRIISDTAAALFAEFGFAQTSVSRIAQACQISKSVIFHYYPAKEDILYAVMHTHMEELSGAMAPELYDTFSSNECFREFSRQLLNRYAGEANSQKVLLYELANLTDDQRKQIIKQQRVLIDFASSLLRNCIAPNQLNETRIRTQVMLFFGMINWSHTWFNANNPISRDELAIYAADTTTGALT